MFLKLFVVGLATVLAENRNYGNNIQDSNLDFKVKRNTENTAIKEAFNIHNKIDSRRENKDVRYIRTKEKYDATITEDLRRERRHVPINRLTEQYATNDNKIYKHNNRTTGFNNWNNNSTRNNNNGFSTWNTTRYNYNGTNNSGFNGNRYPGVNTTRYNSTVYGPIPIGYYNTTPGYNGNKNFNYTPQFYYPVQNNYNSNGSRPGYNSGIGFNNTKPVYNNFNYAPTPFPAYNQKTGNNTGFNAYPPGYMPYPGNYTRYIAPNNTVPGFNYNATGFNYTGFNNFNYSAAGFNKFNYSAAGFNNSYYNPVPITPGYNLKPGTNYTLPINNISCTRCNANVNKTDDFITQKNYTMNACAIMCNDCPVGMKRYARVCVPESYDPDEDY